MKALVKVNQSICLPENSERQLTSDSIPPTANFYSLLFFFLGELMDWYARRFKCRLLQSRHENVYIDFCNLVSSIQDSTRGFMHAFKGVRDISDSDTEIADVVMQHPDLFLWEDARLSQIGRQNTDRRFAAQNALTRLLIWEIQHSAEQRLKLRENRSLLLLQLFNEASRRLQPVGEPNSAIVCLTTAPGQDLRK